LCPTTRRWDTQDDGDKWATSLPEDRGIRRTGGEEDCRAATGIFSCSKADLAKTSQYSATKDAIIWYSTLAGDFQVAKLL